MGAPRPPIVTPLRNSYWVLPGKVLAGEHPSGSTPEATRERLKRLIDAGVECFIDLTEPGEIKAYDAELPFSIEYLRKPIKDHGIPAQRVHMAEILDCLHDTLLSGRCVYVHCRAGIGRTGTVIGCFLVERGLGGEAALDELNRLWQQCERAQSWGSVPETEDQVKFVRGWKARAVFDDRGQLAEPTLTVDDDDPPTREEGAPWAHLLIDSPSATAPAKSVPQKTARRPPPPATLPAAARAVSPAPPTPRAVDRAPPKGGPAGATPNLPATSRSPGGASSDPGASPRGPAGATSGLTSAPGGLVTAPPHLGTSARGPAGTTPDPVAASRGPAGVTPSLTAASASPLGAPPNVGASVRGSAGATPGLTGIPASPTGAPPDLPARSRGSPGAAPELAPPTRGSPTAPLGAPAAARGDGGAPTGLTTAAPPAATPGLSRAPATTPSRSAPAASPNAANLLTDPTSVANASRAHTPSVANSPARTQFLDDPDEDLDPLLNPEALAAASTLRARFHGALLGLAIGDAVAAATQFRRPGSFTPIGDMLGGGPFDLPRGGWSDDTAMALCLADSLLERDGFDARDQVERYRRWQQEGYLTATGQCVGITASSARAIAMAQWRRQAFSGSHDPTQLDPEPLSRVAPVVLFFFSNHAQSIEQATEAARTTCQAPAVLEACRSLAQALHAALSGQPKSVVLAHATLAAAAVGGATLNTGTSGAGTPGSARREAADAGVSAKTALPAAVGLARPGVNPRASANPRAPHAAPGASASEVRDGTTAPAALASAVAAFGATDNFRDAVLYSANLGGDSDVIAAVCGQLAGAYYGVKAIPTSWHNGLMRKELITSYADRLLAHAMLGMAG